MNIRFITLYGIITRQLPADYLCAWYNKEFIVYLSANRSFWMHSISIAELSIIVCNLYLNYYIWIVNCYLKTTLLYSYMVLYLGLENYWISNVSSHIHYPCRLVRLAIKPYLISNWTIWIYIWYIGLCAHRLTWVSSQWYVFLLVLFVAIEPTGGNKMVFKIILWKKNNVIFRKLKNLWCPSHFF